ncbi:hypothetical protein EJB05_13983, partial [Eragrostis curvula]
MEIARVMDGSFIAGNITSGFLRNKIMAQHWSLCLANFRANIQRNVSLFGGSPPDFIRKNKHALCFLNKEESLIYSPYSDCLVEDNVPSVTIYDVMSGSIKREGKFDVLAWKSHVSPYKYYTFSCMIEKSLERHGCITTMTVNKAID